MASCASGRSVRAHCVPLSHTGKGLLPLASSGVGCEIVVVLTSEFGTKSQVGLFARYGAGSQGNG